MGGKFLQPHHFGVPCSGWETPTLFPGFREPCVRPSSFDSPTITVSSLRSCQGDAWVREWALLPCHLSVTLRAGGVKEKRPQMMHGSSAVHHLSSALVAKGEGDGEVVQEGSLSRENTGKGSCLIIQDCGQSGKPVLPLNLLV